MLFFRAIVKFFFLRSTQTCNMTHSIDLGPIDKLYNVHNLHGILAAAAISISAPNMRAKLITL